MVNPRKLPKFIRQSATAYKRLGQKWRKPRGRQSKLREKEGSHGRWPTVGYRAPKSLRYLHPSGLKEILVSNIKDLEKVDANTAIKIAHTVGKKKRQEILKKVEELKIKILNK